MFTENVLEWKNRRRIDEFFNFYFYQATLIVFTSLPKTSDKKVTACVLYLNLHTDWDSMTFYFYREMQRRQYFSINYSKQGAQPKFTELFINKIVIFQRFSSIFFRSVYNMFKVSVITAGTFLRFQNFLSVWVLWILGNFFENSELKHV